MRTVIHEIRNQLAVAVANVEAFIDGKLQATPDRLQSVLQVLNELDALIDELRLHIPSGAPAGIARTGPSPARMREIDVCALIADEALSIEAAALAKGLRYEISRCEEKHPSCARFVGDPVRVAEIVQNVLLNAVRYTPLGGSVNVDCRRSGTELAFSVRDSGLGLTAVKRFVEEHGGRALVESDSGQGATFVVALPGSVSEKDDPLLPRIV